MKPLSNQPSNSADRGIDLHTHSTASDGSFPPGEVVKMAHDIGLRAVSLTDHDTLGGQEEAEAAATKWGLQYVTGIELSTNDEFGKYHMLGYGFDVKNDALNTRLEDVRKSRQDRNALIMEKVAKSGLGFNWDDVLAEAGPKGDVVGRPHIAAAMIKKGIVKTTQEAFDQYLAEGKPLYLPKDGLTSEEAVALIHQAGGIAVMAHPGLSSWKDEIALTEQLKRAKRYGLDGLEVFYSQHTEHQTEVYSAIAERLGLVKTGGSDFHGAPKPNVALGVVVNGGPAPLFVLSGIKAALAR